MILGKKRLCFAIALLLGGVFSLPLNAATLSIDNTFFGYNWISVTYNGSVINPDPNLDLDTGTFQVKYEEYETWGFCVDLGTELDLSQSTNSYGYSTQNPVDYNTNLAYVEWLLDEYGQNAYSTTNGKATRGAALQLAIWEVLYDLDVSSGSSNSYNLDSGGTGTDKFKYGWNEVEASTGDQYVNDFYDEYINALTLAITEGLNSLYVSSGNYVVAKLIDTDDANDPKRQDIIVNVVPEPTTALLLGFGLLGLCAVGRKRA